jgi:hypothetical protein
MIKDGYGRWCYHKGLKTIIFDTKNRHLLVDNGRLKVKFGSMQAAIKLTGSGLDDNLKLTSIEGLPTSAYEFDLSMNKLTSLEGIGEYHSYDLSNNQITSLKGLPEHVNEDLILAKNALTTLEGGPKEVFGIIDVSYNQLTDLKGMPIDFTNSYLHDNPLKTAYGLKEITTRLSLSDLKGIPDKEYEFLRDRLATGRKEVRDYMKELITFVTHMHGAKAIVELNLPEEYLETMPDDLKTFTSQGRE